MKACRPAVSLRRRQVFVECMPSHTETPAAVRAGHAVLTNHLEDSAAHRGERGDCQGDEWFELVIVGHRRGGHSCSDVALVLSTGNRAGVTTIGRMGHVECTAEHGPANTFRMPIGNDSHVRLRRAMQGRTGPLSTGSLLINHRQIQNGGIGPPCVGCRRKTLVATTRSLAGAQVGWSRSWATWPRCVSGDKGRRSRDALCGLTVALNE